ncbi:MAG: hypothetical protein IJN42_01945, partial [Clostridia bacterium]|nr:hypothetical protein [Clostridia bacterium]
MIHSSANWIWIDSVPQANEFAYFEERFDYRDGRAVFSVCAETDYVLYVNGRRVALGQFAGYPDEKYCDDVDITPWLVAGENQLRLVVRYEGLNSATHIDDGAGVIYSLSVAEQTLLVSSEKTVCGYAGGYVQGQPRLITVQLGYATDLCCCPDRPTTAVLQQRNCKILPRPVKKAEILPPLEAKEMGDGLYDLGRETAGYLFARLQSAHPGAVKVAYGQHIEDGDVRYLVGGRNFSFDLHTEAGEGYFEVLFVRISGRYLRVFLPEGVRVLSIGLLPVLYPVEEQSLVLSDPLEQLIYDVSVRTLRLCMNQHYEDTPWREQALYVMDSRNQMLCGYYAFAGYEFQRANLVLMTKGRRADGLLELTFPAVNTPAIPFFSLMYPVAVWEYIKHTGDQSILTETWETMRGIMTLFRDKIGKNGLISSFPSPCWNFYEWSEGNHDPIPRTGRSVPCDYEHLILNCAYVFSARHFQKICDLQSKDFESDAAQVKDAVEREFFEEDTGLFCLRSDRKGLYSQLGNAFAMLIGLGDERTKRAVMGANDLIPATLSMLPFVYDALLAFGEKEYVLNDIRAKY